MVLTDLFSDVSVTSDAAIRNNCVIITSKRRRDDVVIASCVRW